MPPLDQAPTPPPGGKPAPLPKSTPAPVKIPPPPHAGYVPNNKSAAGPIVGAVIIVGLLVLGALYFWGAYLNSRDTTDPLPLIPGDSVQE